MTAPLRENKNMTVSRVDTLFVCVCFSSMLIPVKSKDKLDVKIDIINKKDNAYNTKVILNFTPNINYVKVKVRFLLSSFFLMEECRKKNYV